MENKACIRVDANIEQINRCKKTIEENELSLGTLSNALSLAGNNVRLSILFLLRQEGRLCVCDLSDILNMNVSAISQHLRKLKDRNMIYADRNGQIIYYSLTMNASAIYQSILDLIEVNPLIESE